MLLPSCEMKLHREAIRQIGTNKLNLNDMILIKKDTEYVRRSYNQSRKGIWIKV